MLLEHHLLDGDGLSLCRRLNAQPSAPRVIVYTAEPGSASEELMVQLTTWAAASR